MKEQKGQKFKSLFCHFLECSVLFLALRKRKRISEDCQDVRWMSVLPVLATQCLIVSIRDSGEFLLPLLFLLLLLLGQSPLEVLYHTVLLLLGPITLTLLEKQESEAEWETAIDALICGWISGTWAKWARKRRKSSASLWHSRTPKCPNLTEGQQGLLKPTKTWAKRLLQVQIETLQCSPQAVKLRQMNYQEA